MPRIDDAQLCQLGLRHSMVGKIVVAIADGCPLDIHHRRTDAVEHQSHGARGIGFKREAHQTIHVGNFGHILCGARGILGGLRWTGKMSDSPIVRIHKRHRCVAMSGRGVGNLCERARL